MRNIQIHYYLRPDKKCGGWWPVGGGESYHETAFFRLHGCGFLQKLLFSCECIFPIVSCYKLSESIKRNQQNKISGSQYLLTYRLTLTKKWATQDQKRGKTFLWNILKNFVTTVKMRINAHFRNQKLQMRKSYIWLYVTVKSTINWLKYFYSHFRIITKTSPNQPCWVLYRSVRKKILSFPQLLFLAQSTIFICF